MTLLNETDLQSFVLLRLGDRRFAVTATQIAELVAPSRIVPVCDVAEKLIGNGLKSRRFYLIVQRRYGSQTEWVALPVTGDCELINTEMTLPSETDAPHVAGWLSHAGDVIEVLNLAALTPGPTEIAPSPTPPQLQEVRP